MSYTVIHLTYRNLTTAEICQAQAVSQSYLKWSKMPEKSFSWSARTRGSS